MLSIFLTIIAILFGLIALMLIYAHRNDLVYENSSRALNIISKQNDGDAIVLWDIHFSNGYYNKHLLNIFEWTFEQMYPGLEKLEK